MIHHDCGNCGHAHQNHRDGDDELTGIFAELFRIFTGHESDNATVSTFVKLLFLTLFVAAVQCVVGLWNNNLLLLCHCAHSTFDALQLGVATVSALINQSKRAHLQSSTFSYGLQRLPILGAFTNATFGILVSLYLLVEALHRYSNGVTGGYYPVSLLSITVLSLSVKIYGIYAIQNTMKGGHQKLTPRILGSVLRNVFRLSKRGRRRLHRNWGGSNGGSSSSSSGSSNSSNSSSSNSNSSSRSSSGGGSNGGFGVGNESSLELILTMTIFDAMRGMGLLIACVLTSYIGNGWFTHIDMVLSLCTCIFIFVTVWPIFENGGTLLLQRSPKNVNIQSSIHKCIKTLAAERGVLEIRDQHFWQQTDDLLVGSLSVLVDGTIEEEKMTIRVQQLFEPMNLFLLTVQVMKEKTIN
jgi:cation diffusion facilitator family transporter